MRAKRSAGALMGVDGAMTIADLIIVKPLWPACKRVGGRGRRRERDR